MSKPLKSFAEVLVENGVPLTSLQERLIQSQEICARSKVLASFIDRRDANKSSPPPRWVLEWVKDECLEQQRLAIKLEKET